MMFKSLVDFYGFSEEPFKRIADVDFFYLSQSHKEALSELSGILASDGQVAILTGDYGTGKTILLRKFLRSIPDDVLCDYIQYPDFSLSSILDKILEDFNVTRSVGSIQIDHNEAFKTFISRKRDDGKKVLLVIDEAQKLSEDNILEINAILDMDRELSKTIRFLLVGGSDLQNAIKSSHVLGSFSKKVQQNASLSNLLLDECQDYINFRLKRVSKEVLLVSSTIAATVFRYTKGNPGLVNVLMDKTLIAAYMDNSTVIKKVHLDRALTGLNTVLHQQKDNAFGSVWKKTASVMVLALLVAGGYKVYQKLSADITPIAIVATPEKQVNTVIPAVSNNKTVGITPSVVNTDNVTPDAVGGGSAIDNSTMVAVVDTVDNATLDNATIIAGTDIPLDNVTVGTQLGGIPATVSVVRLNVRVEPQLDADRVVLLSKGDVLTVLKEEGDWAQVLLLDGRTGWVFKNYLQLQ